MKQGTKSIVILGGGTAGWITANLMATHWEDQGIDITLVESPNIGIIGVKAFRFRSVIFGRRHDMDFVTQGAGLDISAVA